jgi:hypothetical protein
VLILVAWAVDGPIVIKSLICWTALEVDANALDWLQQQVSNLLLQLALVWDGAASSCLH